MVLRYQRTSLLSLSLPLPHTLGTFGWILRGKRRERETSKRQLALPLL